MSVDCNYSENEKFMVGHKPYPGSRNYDRKTDREELARQIAQLIQQVHCQRQMSKELAMPPISINRMSKSG